MKKTFHLVFLLNCVWAFAQSEIEIKQLDSVTNWIENRLDIDPGSSLIIIKENKTIFAASHGLSSIELNVPNSQNTMYDLASIGKMFTGYCIAKLEAQGKISMEEDIRKYLKEFPDYGRKISIHHLVHHTSGIKNWTYLINEMGMSDEDKITTEILTRLIYAQKDLDFVPGARYKYSNSGYVLLTKIIEEVTGLSFVEWTKQNIFDPLKMERTFFNDNRNRVIEKMASAYTIRYNGNTTKKIYNTSALGSSSLISNTEDMAKWMNFLLSPPADKKEIIDLMFSTRHLNDGSENNYAYGIEIDDYNGIKLIGHDGSWSSFTSNMVIVPEHNIGIFFANNFRTNTRRMLELYLDVFFPKKNQNTANTPTKESTEEVIVSKNLMDKYTGTYKLDDAWYLEITRESEDLYTRANGERKFYMRPINDSTFVVRNYGNRTITFNMQKGEEKSHQLVYNKIQAKRKTDPFYFDNQAFKKYEGVYFNTELDLLFTIELTKNKLSYSNIKQGKFDLIYENDKLFFTDGNLSKLAFEFDDQNRVIGFYKINSRKERLYYYQKAN